jgi:hypothetical protein
MWYYHFDPEGIKQLFENRAWSDFCSSYSPAAVARHLGLKNAMVVAYEILADQKKDPKEYVITLLYVLRGMYPSEWAAAVIERFTTDFLIQTLGYKNSMQLVHDLSFS